MYMRCDGGWSAEIQIQPWRLESVAAKSYRIACLQQCMQCNASTAMAYTPTRPRTYLHAHAHTYTHTHTHAKGTEPWGIPKWRLADFPSGESAKSQHFTVVDASENEVVAAVLHTQTDIRGIGKMVVSGVPAITQEVNLHTPIRNGDVITSAWHCTQLSASTRQLATHTLQQAVMVAEEGSRRTLS